jgi:cytochrome P450
MTQDFVIPPAPPLRLRRLGPVQTLLEFPRNAIGVYTREDFDDLFGRARFFGRDTLLLNDPADARHVLGPGRANYVRPISSLRIVRPIAGAGLITAEGEAWKRQRRRLATTFTPAAIDSMIPHFQKAADGLLARLSEALSANLSMEFQETALDAVLRALFSLDDSGEREVFATLVRSYIAGPGKPTLWDGLARREEDFGWASASRRRFGRTWSAAVDALIAHRRSDPGRRRSDMLDLLLAARDPETGEGLPDAEIRDQCGTMLFAGLETTARLLFWTGYLLTLDPAEQRRLRSQAREAPTTGIEHLADLERWPRLRCVLLEALRLYPPAPSLLREAVADDVLAGERVAPGAWVWIVPWVMHRHTKFWDNPTAFRPDRFAGKAAPWTEGAFMPFGAGPRICIGAAFALAEAQVIMGAVLSRFTLTLSDERPVLPIGRITLAPDHEPMFQISPAAD